MRFEEIPTSDLITDSALVAFCEHRVERTAEEFGLDRSGWPSQLVLHWRDGAPGRSIIPGQPSGCLIHLSLGADEYQARYQLAHEVTHAVLCPNHTAFDWVEEMFAVHVSLRALFEMGSPDYGVTALEQLVAEADTVALATQEMIDADLEADYPDDLYPKVFSVGVELIEIVGWEQLKRLGCLFDEFGKHDVRAWVEELDVDEQDAVRRVLGG